MCETHRHCIFAGVSVREDESKGGSAEGVWGWWRLVMIDGGVKRGPCGGLSWRLETTWRVEAMLYYLVGANIQEAKSVQVAYE